MIFLLVPTSYFFDVYGQSEFDSTALGLQMPTITMNPTSGQPGTEVEIKVTNMSAVPENIDPRIEFFIYMPFLSAIGGNVPQNCAGDSCFALYSFDEVGEGKFAPKTITFTLFSTTNPKPVLEAGDWNSICDIKINGQTTERYSNTCIDQDQPLGDYEIKFGWGIQTSELYDVRETLTFTVTEKEFVPEQIQQDKDEFVLEQFEEGLISESEFKKRLAELGYDPEEIRQAQALIGKLEHQEGFQASPASLMVTLDDSVYEPGDFVNVKVIVFGTTNANVAIGVTSPDGTNIVSRTVSTEDGSATLNFKLSNSSQSGIYDVVATASINGQTVRDSSQFTVKSTESGVAIRSLESTDQQGNHVSSFERGKLGFVKIVLESESNTDSLVTINLFDSELTTLGIGSFKTTLSPGKTEVTISFFIPDSATSGRADMYANVFSDWPSNGGVPLTTEKSASVELR